MIAEGRFPPGAGPGGPQRGSFDDVPSTTVRPYGGLVSKVGSRRSIAALKPGRVDAQPGTLVVGESQPPGPCDRLGLKVQRVAVAPRRGVREAQGRSSVNKALPQTMYVQAESLTFSHACCMCVSRRPSQRVLQAQCAKRASAGGTCTWQRHSAGRRRATRRHGALSAPPSTAVSMEARAVLEAVVCEKQRL